MEFSKSLKLNHIFQRLYRTQGRANGLMVLYVRPNRLGINRVGITVGKKLGHAVVRNRVRRRMREVYRLNEKLLSPGWDLVIVMRSRSVDSVFSDLNAGFLKLADQSGILRKLDEQI